MENWSKFPRKWNLKRNIRLKFGYLFLVIPFNNFDFTFLRSNVSVLIFMIQKGKIQQMKHFFMSGNIRQQWFLLLPLLLYSVVASIVLLPATATTGILRKRRPRCCWLIRNSSSNYDDEYPNDSSAAASFLLSNTKQWKVVQIFVFLEKKKRTHLLNRRQSLGRFLMWPDSIACGCQRQADSDKVNTSND